MMLVLSVGMAPVLPGHWATLARMFTTYTQPGAALRRYLGNRGAYPWQPILRTPMGAVQPALSNYHDLLTVNEVFCRRDYGSGKGVEVLVDIGANIGLAAVLPDPKPNLPGVLLRARSRERGRPPLDPDRLRGPVHADRTSRDA